MKVKITNPEAINMLESDIVEISLNSEQGIPAIGSKIIIQGHTHDAFWRVFPDGVLANEFHFTDYLPSLTIGGGPMYLNFRPEEKFYLNATVISLE